MKRILSALLTGVLLVVGGVAAKTGLKRVAPALVKETAETGAKQGAKQTAKQATKKAGQAAKSTKAQKGAAATATSGAAATAATQIHDTDDSGQIVDEAEAHEPTEYDAGSAGEDREKRYRKRDLADTSGL